MGSAAGRGGGVRGGGLVGVVVPAARADVRDSFTQPGSYAVVAPPNAYLADITVAGASGADGQRSITLNSGGVGGVGGTVSAQARVFPGESFPRSWERPAGAGRGAAGDHTIQGFGTGQDGGNGGEFSELFNTSGNASVPQGMVVLAGGGGGGGGAGYPGGSRGGDGASGWPATGATAWVPGRVVAARRGSSMPAFPSMACFRSRPGAAGIHRRRGRRRRRRGLRRRGTVWNRTGWWGRWRRRGRPARHGGRDSAARRSASRPPAGTARCR